MKLMMDVTEYVELPGILPTRMAFAEALYLSQGIFDTKPLEWRVPSATVRALMRTFDEDDRMTHAVLDDNGHLTIIDVPIVVTQGEEHVRLVFKRETLEVARGQ